MSASDETAPTPQPSWPEPRANPHLTGHEAAERALRDAFTGGRLPHAWLITGPRGVGKATLAFRFARYVLAGGGVDGGLGLDADHPVFRRVAAAGHADLKTVERTPDPKTAKLRSVVVVDDVREVGAFLRLTAAEGGWRVVVIDCADDMNINASNAVLKVLEEPPARALLLLVSHSPGRLLPTIRSRCRRLALGPLDGSVIRSLLERYAPDLSPADTRDLRRLAEGSIGRALALAGEGGLDLYRELHGLLATLPGLDVEALHRLGDRVALRGADDSSFRITAELVQWWLGRLIRVAAGAAREEEAAGAAREEEAAGAAREEEDSEDRALMERLAAAGGLDRWLEVWEKINRLLARADSANLDRKQVVLNVFLAIEDAARS